MLIKRQTRGDTFSKLPHEFFHYHPLQRYVHTQDLLQVDNKKRYKQKLTTNGDEGYLAKSRTRKLQ